MSKLSQLRPLFLWEVAVFACMSASFMAMAHAISCSPAPPEMDRRSSRFILPENQQAYIETMVGRLSMTGRKIDPFGRGEVDVKSKLRDIVHPVPPVNAQQALGNLIIDVIFPQENRFLTNGRSYSEGQYIRIRSQGKVFKIEVMLVQARWIKFRDSETGEEVILDLKLMPPGLPDPGIAR